MDRIHLVAHRLAVIGCIYGNVPALQACLADARAEGCDAVLCAGDVLGFCGHAAETLNLVERACAVTIAGNHEQEVVAGTGLCGCGFQDAEDERRSCLASSRQADGLEVADLLRLARWPARVVVDTPHGSLLLCHGSPDRVNEFLHQGMVGAERLRWWLEDAGAQVLACSHTGMPWILDTTDGRLAVNIGAVGKPDHDGDPAVHYAIIDMRRPGARIRRVAYDHQAWVERLLDEGVEPCVANQLTTGRWAWGAPVHPVDLEVM